ncbi:MAG: 7-cyano-7-deazaguanine synthase [Planctomycetes bacterium]|nr:7-cyano-7-deazaguanine synthase [Planctomycetota bacterium]
MTTGGAAPAGPSDRPGRAVALLSGGLDSGVAMAMWIAGGGEVALALCADYGQRAARREADASRRLAARFGVRWRALPLPWLGDAARAAGSALHAGTGVELPQRTESDPGDHASAAAVWVPARNVVLVAAAAAFAEAVGADAVLVGFNREEAATFADNSESFARAMDEALQLGTRSGVVVRSPTLALDKRGIVAAARRLGLGRDEFWSCYEAASDPATCACESCVRSRRAWSEPAS